MTTCITSYDLASLLRGRRNILWDMGWKNHKTHWREAVSSALNFSFLKEASQNYFVFYIVNFEFLRKRRRLASFLMLLISNFGGNLAELLRF
jgi:hypothetical protein